MCIFSQDLDIVNKKIVKKTVLFCKTTRCVGIICLSANREFIILIYAGLFTLLHATIKYLAAFRRNRGEGEREGGGRVPQARPERSKSRMHLSTILVPLSPGPYGISRSVGNGGERAGKGYIEGREEENIVERRRKKGEGESGTQEAPETGCGQLFTSWRMIPQRGALTKPVYVDLQGPSLPLLREKGSIEISIRYRNCRFNTFLPRFYFSSF